MPTSINFSQHKNAMTCRHREIGHGRHARHEEGVEVEEAPVRLAPHGPDQEEQGKEEHGDEDDVKHKHAEARQAQDRQDVAHVRRLHCLHHRVRQRLD
jgi:hypothetical protein